MVGLAFEQESHLPPSPEIWASRMRADCLRMALATGSKGSHIGGALSLVEILAVLYGRILNYDPRNPTDPNRDRFILSKGHGAMAYYAALKQAGFVTDDELLTFKSDQTHLYGHPSMNRALGIEFSTGSLGLGLSLGLGVALALRRKGLSRPRTFVLMGDGECNEGSVWEAASAAAHFQVNSLVAVIDANGLQYDGTTESVLDMGSLAAIWRGFGWAVAETDGHNAEALLEAFAARSEKPLAVVAQTVKGKGVSYMEGDPSWHHRKLTTEQFETAMSELEVRG